MDFPVYETQCSDCGDEKTLILCVPAQSQEDYDQIMALHADMHHAQDPEKLKVRVIESFRAAS